MLFFLCLKLGLLGDNFSRCLFPVASSCQRNKVECNSSSNAIIKHGFLGTDCRSVDGERLQRERWAEMGDGRNRSNNVHSNTLRRQKRAKSIKRKHERPQYNFTHPKQNPLPASIPGCWNDGVSVCTGTAVVVRKWRGLEWVKKEGVSKPGLVPRISLVPCRSVVMPFILLHQIIFHHPGGMILNQWVIFRGTQSKTLVFHRMD